MRAAVGDVFAEGVEVDGDHDLRLVGTRPLTGRGDPASDDVEQGVHPALVRRSRVVLNLDPAVVGEGAGRTQGVDGGLDDRGPFGVEGPGHPDHPGRVRAGEPQPAPVAAFRVGIVGVLRRADLVGEFSGEFRELFPPQPGACPVRWVVAWSRSSGSATGVRRVWKSMTCAALPTVTRSVLPPVLPSEVLSAAPGLMTASRSCSQRGWVNAPAQVTTALAARRGQGGVDRPQPVHPRQAARGGHPAGFELGHDPARFTSWWCWTRPSWVTHSSRSVSLAQAGFSCGRSRLAAANANPDAYAPPTAEQFAQWIVNGSGNSRRCPVAANRGSASGRESPTRTCASPPPKPAVRHPTGPTQRHPGWGSTRTRDPRCHRWRAGPTRGRPACAGASREANPSCP